MRERTIEHHVTRFAKEHGWLTYKWQSTNVRGVPDRMYLKAGQIIFIEFKAPRRRPTKLQKHIHSQIRKEDFNVYVIDDIEAGKLLFS